MKYLIILGDGMADEPIAALGNKTPLQVAHKPHIDRLAKEGRCGMLKTIPEGFTPGSEIANLSVLGYDVATVFEGRGSLEAASMGISLEDNEMAMRCNLICIENGKIKNHSAGHVSNEEASALIAFLNKELSTDAIHFYPGISYRHLLKMKGGDKHLRCTPPHDVPGTPFKEVMIQPETPEATGTAHILNELTLKSQQLLESHPINRQRQAEGKDPANSIWLWSPGYKPQMPTLMQRYGITSGAVISAVDLIKGIGVYAGLQPVEVEGATGLYNTNYEGKAQAAIEALRQRDFVYLHIEASDEAGHDGDAPLKIRTIEYLDNRVVKPIAEAVSQWDEPVTIALLPDHPTPCNLRTHTSNPVPFIIWCKNTQPDSVQCYDEEAARNGIFGQIQYEQFMELLLKKCR